MSEPKSPGEWAERFLTHESDCTSFETYFSCNCLIRDATKAILLAQKQARKEALEEAADMIEGNGPAKSMIMVGVAKAIRALIEKENEE